MRFVSRGGEKLEHGLSVFGIDVSGLVCTDLGCSTGGFTDCLLQRGAAKVYAVDTGYGVLDYKLRKDPRVVVMERTNAMHVSLPEKVGLATIDASWTRQRKLLPHVATLLQPDAAVVTLLKPHYEADPSMLVRGVLPDQHVEPVLAQVRREIEQAGFAVLSVTESPLRGSTRNAGNREFLAMIRRA